MKQLGFISVLLLLTFSGISAEKNTKCRDELQRLCGREYPNGKNLGQCIKLGIDKLSPECRPRRIDFPAVRRDCKGEIVTSCSGSTDDGKTYQCLRRKLTETPDSVSVACATRMNQ